MSRRRTLPDPIRFAAERGEASGSIDIASLMRLSEMLHDSSGSLAWQLRGDRDADGRSFLRFEVHGQAALTCQRCLERLEWRIAVKPALRLVPEGSEIPDEELEVEAYDTIEAVRDLDLLALVEDELLLSVPLAPMHETCEPPQPAGEAADESPFAALAKLRQRS